MANRAGSAPPGGQAGDASRLARLRPLDPAAKRLYVPLARDPARAAPARLGDVADDEPQAGRGSLARRGRRRAALPPHRMVGGSRLAHSLVARARADARDARAPERD